MYLGLRFVSITLQPEEGICSYAKRRWHNLEEGVVQTDPALQTPLSVIECTDVTRHI